MAPTGMGINQFNKRHWERAYIVSVLAGGARDSRPYMLFFHGQEKYQKLSLLTAQLQKERIA
jgi:hypothetical protein